MVGRTADLTARLQAQGAQQAAAEVDRFADALERAERSSQVNARATLDDQATQPVIRLADRLDALTREDRRIVMRAQLDQLNAELRQTETQLRSVKTMSDDDIVVTLRARNELQREIDELQTDIRELDRAEASPRLSVDDRATPDINEVRGRLQQLEREETRARLLLDASRFESDLRDATAGLGRFDGATASARLEAIDSASDDLDRVGRELRDLDGETATVHVDADTGGARSALDNITEKLGALPGRFGDVGSSIGALAGAGGLGAMTAGVGALAAGGLALAENFAEAAMQARVTASLTGDSIEDASRLQAVWQRTGADLNDLNDVLLQMNGVLQTNPEIVRQLGINLQDGRTIGERFLQVIEAIESSTLGAQEKAQLMAQAFGEEGVRQVARLTTTVRGDLRGAIDGVSEVQIIDEEEAERAAALTAQMQNAKIRIQELGMTVAENLLDPATESLRKLTQIASLEFKTPDTSEFQRSFEEMLRQQRPDIYFEEYATEAERAAYRASQAFVPVTAELFRVQTGLQGLSGQYRQQADELVPVNAELGRYRVGLQGIGVDQRTAAERAEDMGAALVRNAETVAQALVGLRGYDDAVRSMDWGRAELEGALTAQTQYTSSLNALGDIAADYETAIDRVKEAVGDQALTLDTATEAGRKQRDALRDVAAVLDTELAAAYDDANGNFDVFRSKAEEITNTTLTRLATELGLSGEQVEQLRVALGLTEGDYEARFALSGAEEARIKLELLQASIDGLPPDVETRVNQLIIQGDYVGALQVIQDFYAGNPAQLPTDAVAREYQGARGAIMGAYWGAGGGVTLPADAQARDFWGAHAAVQGQYDRNHVRLPADAQAWDFWGARDVIQRNYDRNPASIHVNGQAWDIWGAHNVFTNAYSRNPASLHVDGQAWNIWGAHGVIQRAYNNNPVTVPVIPAVGRYAEGTPQAPVAGVAGENYRLEFVNGRMAAGPTIAPRGARVTSEQNTERMMQDLIASLDRVAAGGGDGGGGGSGSVVYQTNNVYMPAGSNPTDVQRSLQRFAERNGGSN